MVGTRARGEDSPCTVGRGAQHVRRQGGCADRATAVTHAGICFSTKASSARDHHQLVPTITWPRNRNGNSD
jgi:hypothetical protein